MKPLAISQRNNLGLFLFTPTGEGSAGEWNGIRKGQQVGTKYGCQLTDQTGRKRSKTGSNVQINIV